MTRVMICGSRDESDIDLLVRAGVDAIGLITEVRQVILCNLSRERARRLGERVPPLISVILIVTEERVDELCRMVECVRPDAVQLHGFNEPEDVAMLKAKVAVRIVKTIHLQGERAVRSDEPDRLIGEYLRAGADAILLDSYHEGDVGATGRTIDLDTARRLRDAAWPRPTILAGGLHPGNVSEAIARVQPFGVDVLTGVTRQGHLDPEKVQAFVRTIREDHEEGDERFAR